MTVPPHHFDDSQGDPNPGGLLGDLERRQDDVLQQLDDLDAKLSEVLAGLEPTRGPASYPTDSGDPDDTGFGFSAGPAAADFDSDDDFDSAEDWA